MEDWTGLPLEVKTIAESLSENGYRTAITGTVDRESYHNIRSVQKSKEPKKYVKIRLEFPKGEKISVRCDLTLLESFALL